MYLVTRTNPQPAGDAGRKDTMNYIRQTYGVPAKRGARVRYTGVGTPRYGTIKSACGGHLRVLLDGDSTPRRYHPTWEIQYL